MNLILISGKSGSGKSTLGSVMNGLIPHYYKGKMKGKAFVSGKDISKLLLHEVGHIVGDCISRSKKSVFHDTTEEEIAFWASNYLQIKSGNQTESRRSICRVGYSGTERKICF